MTVDQTDKLFINGIILTQDMTQPQVAQLAIGGNRILAVGDNLQAWRQPNTEIIDLAGAVVTPGFIDAHLHLIWGGESLLSMPIAQARSRAEFVKIIADFAPGHPAGSWLIGSGWNEHLFARPELPQREWLDRAAPGYPILLHRHDGHSGVASSVALKLAGIDEHTPGPPGGVIDRDSAGQPTGILRDGALGLVTRVIPEETEADLERNLAAAQDYLLQRGVTAVGNMIYDLRHFYFLQQQARQGRLRVRVTAYTPLLKWAELSGQLPDRIYRDDWFQYQGLKGFCDGSLGSHTALMLEPYADTPEAAGIFDTDWEDPQAVAAIIGQADQQGFQTVVHAIGDRANREVLKVYETVIRQNGPRDRRFRIEHAQHLHPDDQRRLAELGVITSVQPTHCVDDVRYIEQLLGDRCAYAYPFRSLLDLGVRLAFGSDWPVSPAEPVRTLHSAIHRANWQLAEAVDLTAALQAHTATAAFAGFREHDLGLLKPGHLADLVVLAPEFLSLGTQATCPHHLIQAVYVDGVQQPGPSDS